MAFVNLWFLAAGGALMTVPIILHLLRRRRKKVVELSTFRFLFETYHIERRTLKILEYLLLVLRVVAILAIGLFFARPSLQPGGLFGRGGGSRARVLVIDSSASMAAQDRGISRLELAKRLTRELIARSDPDDEISLIDSHSEAEVLARAVRGDTPLLLTKLESIQQTPQAGRLGPAFAKAAAILKDSSHPRKEVFFFSDLQRQAWERYREDPQQAELGSDVVLTLVPLGDPKAVNVAILPEEAPRVRASVRIPAEIAATVVNYSTERREVLLTVTLADPTASGPAEVRRELRRLEPGERWPVRALHTFQQPGFHALRFEISADAYALDDKLLVTTPAAPVARVLLVDGRPSPKAFESGVFYLSRALQPDAAVQDKQKILIEQATVTADQLTAAALAGRDVVVLADVPRLSPPAAAALRGFVAQGGGLLIAPGDQADPAFYNEQLGGPQDVHGPLLPAPLVRKLGSGNDPRRYTFLSGVDYTHPVFALFRGEHAATLAAPRFYTIWELGEPQRGARRLAAFSMNVPALLEGRYGRGKVLLCGFPATVGWSSFPLRPAYVSFFHQAVAYLRPSSPMDQLADAAVGDPLQFDLPPDGRGCELSLISPSAQVERLQLVAHGDGYRASADALKEAGVYKLELHYPGGRSEAGQLATHVPIEESIFERISEQAARASMPGANLTLVEPGEDFAAAAERLASGREIWRTLAAMAIVILLAEFALANRSFLPRRRRSAPVSAPASAPGAAPASTPSRAQEASNQTSVR